jgi:phage gp37-like protein
MSVLAMRDAIVAKIKTTIPALKMCAAHGGRFNEDELERYYVDAPAVLVTCLGKARTEDVGSELHIRWRWAAFVVARDLPKVGDVPAREKHDVAAAIAETLSALVVAENWSGTAARAASDIGIDNLYTGGGDGLGVTFWSVTWTQPSAISIGIETADLPDFLKAHTSWDFAPKNVPVDPDPYEPDVTDELDLPPSEED